MADLLQLPKPNKERGIRRMRGCVRLPLSLFPFFSFGCRWCLKPRLFDWRAVCCVFILILELSNVVRFHDPLCAFVWGRTVVFMLCALCVFFLSVNLCPVQQTEKCEPYNVCSYLILFPWPFALYVFVCVSMKHFGVYVFVCVYQR